MHLWTVTVTIRPYRGHFSPASARQLAAELEHLDVKIDLERSPATVELSILAVDAQAAFRYAQRRITEVLLPGWPNHLTIEPGSASIRLPPD
jgi:hypothetical protein